VLRGVSQQTCASWDDTGYALLVAVHGFVPDTVDPYLVLGILNSSLCDWLHRVRFYSARIPKGSLRYPISFWESVPVVIEGDKDTACQVALLAKQLADSTKSDPAVVNALNESVFQLYGVSEEELNHHYPLPKG